ncbi:MAG: carbohydrate ABC transporter substrate-binding protein [Oscillospiraceae bacterium]
MKNGLLKSPKFISAVIVSAAVFASSGCSINIGRSSQKEEPITVYLWDISLINSYAPYIQSKLPDIEIEFVIGNNDLDFYKFLNENGELPDIITNRRFSLHDAAELQPQLMDLSETEQAGAVYLSYLSNYTNSDGTVNWLPLCGETDGFVANKDLFEQYDIPLPTDCDSFVSACREFEKHGIRGFVSDFAYDYTCMEILQGLSIHELTSKDGQSWRSIYENVDIPDNGLDSEIWPHVFERMERFISDVGLSPDDVKLSYDPVCNMFFNGEVAIIRETGTFLPISAEKGIDAVMLPYFGDNGSEWLLTYPSFHVALNKELSSNKKRLDQALQILDVMLSEEGQNFLAQKKDVVPYSENISLELADSLTNLQPYIDSNHLYIRLASNDFFSASRDTVQKMITGEYTAQQAYDAFNQQLNAPKSADETAAEFSCKYSNTISGSGTREASSVIANTLREYYDTDILIAPSYSFTGPVMDTDYSLKMLGYMIMPNALCAFRRDMTGAELRTLLKAAVEGAEDAAFKPFNIGSLPAVSGAEITVKGSDERSYTFENVKINGEDIDDGAVYSVIYLDCVSYFNGLTSALYPDEGSDAFTRQSTRVRETWTEYILGGASLAEPSEYILLK